MKISLAAVLSDFEVIEIPNSWSEREMGKSKFKILHESIKFLIILIVFYRFKIKKK